MSVKIITDSGADLGSVSHKDLEIVPLMVRFGDEEFLDGVGLDGRQFYERLVESDALPQTSQVTPFAFEQAMDRGLADHDEVLVITISSKLSGTYQSANLAAMDKENVWLVDSENASLGEGILVELALMLADKGYCASEIASVLNEKKKQVHLVALLDTLEYLKKGGRISSTAAFAGSVLSIKPVIGIVDGAVSVLGKARGSRKGNNLLVSEVSKAGGIDFDLPWALGYTGLDDSLLKKYVEDSKEVLGYGDVDAPVCLVGPAIGAHAGPGAVAVAFFAKD